MRGSFWSYEVVWADLVGRGFHLESPRLSSAIP